MEDMEIIRQAALAMIKNDPDAAFGDVAGLVRHSTVALAHQSIGWERETGAPGQMVGWTHVRTGALALLEDACARNENDHAGEPRMSGGDLAAFEDALGVTDVQVAQMLGVRRDTVAKWKSGRQDIPYRVSDDLRQAALNLAARATSVAEGLRVRGE